MPRLTLDYLKKADFADVLKVCYEKLDEFAAKVPETDHERDARLNKTLDELPDWHAFFLEGKAWFSHWTDGYAADSGYGTRSPEYKAAKSRRDALDDVARAARLRYEGASRRITILQEQQAAAGMRPARRG